MKKSSSSAAAERKVLRLALEAYPLRVAEASSSSTVTCIAVTKEGDSYLIHVGTNNGRLFLYSWRPSLVPSSPSPASYFALDNSAASQRNGIPALSRSSPSQSPSNDSQLHSSPRTSSFSSSPSNTQPAQTFRPSKFESSENVGAVSSQRDAKLLLQAQRAIGMHRLQHLCTLPEASRIALLSAGHIILLDLHSLDSLKVLAAAKGASAMTRGLISRAHSTVATTISSTTAQLESSTTITGLSKSVKEEPGELLLVSVKKKLLLFKVFPVEVVGKNNAPSSDVSVAVPPVLLLKEMLVGVDGVMTMACIENSVFMGTQREFIMLSMVDGHVMQLFSRPEESPWNPLLKPLPKISQVLFVIDNIGIILNKEGQPIGGSIIFETIPDAVGQTPPYVLVHKQGTFDLFHLKTGQKLQSSSLDTMESPYFVAEDDDGSLVVVANSSKLNGLLRVTLDEQVKELLKKRKFEEAISLAEESVLEGDDPSGERLAIVYAEAGFIQLFDLRFQEAIDNLLRSELVEPAELFPFFPALATRWRGLVPWKRYWGLHPPPQPLILVIQNGLLAIQHGLLESPTYGQRNDIMKSSSVSISSKRASSGEHYFASAIESFIRYWKVVRESNLSSAVKEGVDTILMMLYIEVGASEELQELAASTNSCLLV